MLQAEALPPAEAARLFAALGEPIRLRLILQLADRQPRSISALSSGSGLTRQAVTKHLRTLEQAGLVASGRAGREARFQIEPQGFAQAKTYLDEVSAQWDGAVDRLKAFLGEA